VLAQFFRLFYEGEEYVEEVEETGKDGAKVKRRQLATFKGSTLEGMRFDVVCEATVGTNSSSAGTIAFLDSLFTAGRISLKTYVKYYPDDALTNKSEILAEIEAMEENQLAQVQAELSQVQAELARCLDEMAKNEKLIGQVRAIIRENQDLNLMLGSLYVESNEKLAAANDQINAGNAKINEQGADLMEALQEIAQLQGLDLGELAGQIMAQSAPPTAG
jgi:hypothetical protein